MVYTKNICDSYGIGGNTFTGRPRHLSKSIKNFGKMNRIKTSIQGGQRVTITRLTQNLTIEDNR